jgi:hypothetical protein
MVLRPGNPEEGRDWLEQALQVAFGRKNVLSFRSSWSRLDKEYEP